MPTPGRAFTRVPTPCDWRSQVSNYSGHHFGCSTCAVTSGRVACQLGHRRMLNLFMDSGAPIGLFFEDDAVVNPALNGLSSGTALRRELHDRFAALKKADKDWDMLFLGRCYDDCRDPQKARTAHSLLAAREAALCSEPRRGGTAADTV